MKFTCTKKVYARSVSCIVPAKHALSIFYFQKNSKNYCHVIFKTIQIHDEFRNDSLCGYIFIRQVLLIDCVTNYITHIHSFNYIIDQFNYHFRYDVTNEKEIKGVSPCRKQGCRRFKNCRFQFQTSETVTGPGKGMTVSIQNYQFWNRNQTGNQSANRGSACESSQFEFQNRNYQNWQNQYSSSDSKIETDGSVLTGNPIRTILKILVQNCGFWAVFLTGFPVLDQNQQLTAEPDWQNCYTGSGSAYELQFRSIQFEQTFLGKEVSNNYSN